MRIAFAGIPCWSLTMRCGWYRGLMLFVPSIDDGLPGGVGNSLLLPARNISRRPEQGMVMR